MLDTPAISLVEYGVSLQNGFLPEVLPLRRLEDPYYSRWEDIVQDLPAIIKAGTIRQAVNNLPILSTENLQQEPEWRRAYVVLAYLTHAYIWGGETPKDRLPPSIARPFIEISNHLELPPCATYAALNLWNFSVPSEDTDLTDPDNLSVVTSFTGTKDEEWFFVLSVAIEAKGAQLIEFMLDGIHGASIDDEKRVIARLEQLSYGLGELGKLLERMYEKCAPSAFYHQLRPFLAGSKNMASAGLPNGVFYDLGDGQGEWHQYSGGSNAQSSLIQAFDIFLGVEHSATGETKSNGKSQTQVRSGYIQHMRNYMPGPHRRFLEMMARTSNVRPYVMSHKAGSALRDAYNMAAMSLGGFRDKHVRMVTRYIIMAARTPPPNHTPSQTNLATTTSTLMDKSHENITGGIRGTGGTDLIPFLKQTRDTTKAAARYVD
ncbi:indoleamine 2,3-dioxygenase [Aspergillus sclerotioniger CBS 115572]|uniref:Indoleamine 2,3-dioxygenase n=1 Tax=Aspergillus sclerotioniger CBS 115572 TaxID=1450535 RepID=A0A317WSJ5_9EURO|nr:indoleamine 2,3-dioxygenase [Aspergillus sclerotioniger CBS 115572]PWY87170.1 indoleamine 2,3-dioxygenase [Aspergillus sclerotioniger CBS 115572]